MAKNGKIKVKDKSRIAVIAKAARLGMTLKEEYPEIAAYYRSGFTGEEIARLFNFAEVYDRSTDVAVRAVGFATSGYPGGYGLRTYTGLIEDEEELRRLRREHWRGGAENRGQTLWISENGHNSELEYAHVLSLSSIYQYRGKPNWRLIAKEVNGRYHNGESVRTGNNLKKGVYRFRQSQSLSA